MRRVHTVPFAASISFLTILAFVSLAGTAFGQEAKPRPVTPRGELSAEEKGTIDLFQRARDSVVYINTSERVVNLWTRNILSTPRGTGSGFVWDERGHVVTNYHVVAGASEAHVRLNDGRDLPATLVGASADQDLAVLRVSVSTPLAPVAVGTSHDLRVGQRVFAIGNPFGLDWTLTTGIISALDRSLPAEGGRRLIEHLIQTDAAINPGNSYGPLLDSAGRLIGVHTAIFSPSGASGGVGFAMHRIMTDSLGVTGVVVLKVTPGSSADVAGLRGVRFGRDGECMDGSSVSLCCPKTSTRSTSRRRTHLAVRLRRCLDFDSARLGTFAQRQDEFEHAMSSRRADRQQRQHATEP